MSAYLKQFFEKGLGIVWPVDLRSDFRELPQTKPIRNPPNEHVKKWNDWMKEEPDVYFRLVFRTIGYSGWRSSHWEWSNWGHLFKDEDTKEFYIQADGHEAGFKKASFVIFRIPPVLQKDLEEWIKLLDTQGIERKPNDPILPWRDASGKIHPAERLHDCRNRVIWKRIRRKRNLPKLLPIDMRHWVATKCREAGLSYVASSYMMGHKPGSGRNGHMRDHYDQPVVQDILMEQAERLPEGTLGMLDAPELNINGLPPKALQVVADFMCGKKSIMEVMNDLEKIKSRTTTISPILTK